MTAGNYRTRRTLLSLAAIGLTACGRAEPPFVGSVALPERSLRYAPLLLAVRERNAGGARGRLSLQQRPGQGAMEQAVVEGSADVAAMPLPDLVTALAAGAPLVAIGALTRRASAFYVSTRPGDEGERRLEALLDGSWWGARAGVERGGGGTAQAVRLCMGARGWPPVQVIEELQAGAVGAPVAPGAPVRWIGYDTDEALVAAIKDHRIAAFVGRSMAAAQAAIVGGKDLSVASAAAELGEDVLGAVCTVLVARRERVAAGTRLFGDLVRDCAQAAEKLAGPQGVLAAGKALPERDALHLSVALRLDAPDPGRAIFAADAQVPEGAVQRLLDLLGRAGTPAHIDSGVVVRPVN
jgi:ABC-type nitrate/sulfonate/bicarbonate transport system substrate-binding protein